MNRLIDHLRRLVEQPLGDADLLDRFIERREDTAFAALLKRHGPMVLGVCRRILGNPQDAEDAFQATFLVLARRAASVRPRQAVGNWLYGVAYRTALEARAKITRRYAREKQVEEMPEPEEQKEVCCHELLSLLDRELHRLPDKYRLPVVLCDLEGRSRKEVAHELAIAEGTLSSRLATAHKRLAWRLTRLGLSFSGVSVAVLLFKSEALACVPALLRVATTRAAMLLTAGQVVGVSAGVITLTEGVLRTMYLAKLKAATLLLCGVATLGLSTGGVLYQTRAGAAGSSGAGQNRVAVRAEAPNRDDEEAQQEKNRAKLAAEQERLKASLRAEAEKARRDAEAQRERAQAERGRAQEALRQLKEQRAKAKQAENASDRAQNRNQDVNRLSEAEAKTREQFKKARQTLMEQMKKLDAEEREVLRKLRAERSLLQKQQSRPGADKAASSGDKLDRILERLDRMERRLDRLERGSKQ